MTEVPVAIRKYAYGIGSSNNQDTYENKINSQAQKVLNDGADESAAKGRIRFEIVKNTW
jgi:hypothetical protein